MYIRVPLFSLSKHSRGCPDSLKDSALFVQAVSVVRFVHLLSLISLSGLLLLSVLFICHRQSVCPGCSCCPYSSSAYADHFVRAAPVVRTTLLPSPTSLSRLFLMSVQLTVSAFANPFVRSILLLSVLLLNVLAASVVRVACLPTMFI